jgi:AcrR family transcriptional regulator
LIQAAFVPAQKLRSSASPKRPARANVAAKAQTVRPRRPPVAAPEAPAPQASSGPELTETRRRLIDAALDAFAERGFEGATTAQIAARAGVAEKTLFANFGSKERLYQAALEPATVVAMMMPEAVRTLTPVLAHPPDDLRGLLRAIIDNRVRFARGHRREMKLLAQHLLLRPESFSTLTAVFAERVAPQVLPLAQRLVAKGGVRDDVPLPALARIVLTTVVGYLFSRIVLQDDRDWDADRDVDHLVAVLADGLVPRTASRKRR